MGSGHGWPASSRTASRKPRRGFSVVPGWLAYDALVLLDNALVEKRFKLQRIRFRQLFSVYFDGFGDFNPDDTFDASD